MSSDRTTTHHEGGASGRYALFYAPPAESPHWRFGCRWLGRDAETGATLAPLALPGLPDEVRAAITAAPRPYGFHATLKPPFALAEGQTREALESALLAFCAVRAPFDTAPPVVAALDRFLAFVLPRPDPRVDALAGACVEAFDAFRRPLSEGERTRRRAGGLSPRQEQYLQRWGYGYVFADFRFHLSLTGPIADEGLRAATLAGLRAAAGEAAHARLRFDGLALFRQEPGDGDFRLMRRVRFGVSRRLEGA